MAGKFITLEGGDGVGKTTQGRRLSDFLRRLGLQVVLTREPGGSEGGEEIRRLLMEGPAARWDSLTEALLHSAARREHLVRTILPALERNVWVVSDRFADSTMAYQGYGQEIGPERIRALNALVLGSFRPDLTLILDLAPEEALKRVDRRGADRTRYEEMDLDFHRRLRNAFTDIAAREPERCVMIDAAQAEGAVAAEIERAVRAHFGLS